MLKLYFISFLIYNVVNTESLSKQSNVHNDLPEITEGEVCTSGNLYKMSCNTCRCSNNNSLICTKMACLNEDLKERFKNQINALNLREGRAAKPSRNKCVPGKLYIKKHCQICFCDDKGRQVCKEKTCKLKLSPSQALNPENFEKVFPVSNVEYLPELEHMAAECTPGRTYRVDCNTCWCQRNGNLACTYKMCTTMEGFNMVAAYRNSGKACSGAYTVKSKCIKCDCVKQRTKCSAISNCKPKPNQVLSGNAGKKMVLDITKEKCVPNMVYRVHCNKCYCQSDETLRCTQKLCLINSEVRKLEKQRAYLEKTDPSYASIPVKIL